MNGDFESSGVVATWIHRTLSGRKRVSTTPPPTYVAPSDHQAKVLHKRRAKNKVARQSRKINRQRAK